MQIRHLVRLFVLVAVLAAAFSVVLPQQAARAECGVYHQVLAGQNLFRISLRYGVSMYDIAAANGITDVRRIYAGQSLYIPCASGSSGAGQSSATVVTNTTVSTGVNTTTTTTTTTVIPSAGVNVVDCTGFRATSPLDGFKDGAETFYWDPPRGGTSVTIYQVIILDDRGRRIASFDTAGGITSVTGNVGFNQIGGRSRFSWYVVALVSGEEVCRTQQTTLNRQWNEFAGLSPQ